MNTATHMAASLRPGDQYLDPVELQLLLAARALCSRYEQDKSALNSIEFPFMKSTAYADNPLSTNQISSLFSILKRHAEPLLQLGISLPDTPDVSAFLKRKEGVGLATTGTKLRSTKIILDVTNEKIIVRFPEHRQEWSKKTSDLGTYIKHAARDGRLKLPGVDITIWKFYNVTEKQWEYPRNDRIWDVITSQEYFPASNANTELTPSASLYSQKREHAAAESRLKIESIRDKKLQEVTDILNAIGGVQNEFAPGFRFFEHQQEDIPLLVRWRYATLAWEQGLGKTFGALFAAKALWAAYGWRIIVVCTLSGKGAWIDASKKLEVPIELFTWKGMPLAKKATAITEGDATWEYWEYTDLGGPFILIADEAQNAQNLPYYTNLKEYQQTGLLFKNKGGSQQSAKFVELALHPDCKACFPTTGTPMPNGRPFNEEALLIATRHPLLYSTDHNERRKKRNKYEVQFCLAGPKTVGRKKKIVIPWDTTGAGFLDLLHKLTVYKAHRDNEPTARMIRRLKKECLDLPEKRRFWQPAEISEKDVQIFERELERSWLRYETNLKRKLEEFIASFTEENGIAPSPATVRDKEERIRMAEALAELTFLRKCASIAKIEHVCQQAYDLATNEDDPRPAVIFTEWRTDVAIPIARRLHELFTGEDASKLPEQFLCIPLIHGKIPDFQRQAIIKKFQAGEYKAIVCTHRAAGEAITLNRASDMWLVDRPWTPGKAQQSEDRIHRIGQRNDCYLYWVQLPEEICKVDTKCDGIVLGKATNINRAVEGHGQVGMQFANQQFHSGKDAVRVLSEIWRETRQKKA